MFCENDKYNITFGWIVFLETILILAFEVNLALNKHHFRIILKSWFIFNLLFYINSIYTPNLLSQKYKFQTKKKTL